MSPTGRAGHEAQGSSGVVDLWRVLGLAPDANPDTLKRAFRSLARRWHPDLNGNDPVAEERFKRVNEAYAVLTDPRRKREWERDLGRGDTPRPPGGPTQQEDPFSLGFPRFEDYLAVVLGRGRPKGVRARDGASERSAGTRGEPSPVSDVTAAPPPPPPVKAVEDLVTIVDLSVEEALQGRRVKLSLPDGSLVEVWTPAMAGDGWRLRLAGAGPRGGDHFLELRVCTPDGLRIEGLRVDYDLELLPADAVLGCTVEVPTLEGPVMLRVPPASASGRLLRLRGRGLERDGERGDQMVQVRIVVPDEISDVEEALYRRLREVALEED